LRLPDNTLRLWDTATGQQIGPAMQHEGGVNGALLFKDQSRILSWSSDKTLRLWDAATGKQIGPAIQHEGSVNGALLFKDESRILSWTGRTLRLWDNRWPKGNLVRVTCELLPDYDLTQISQHYGVSITDPICADGVTLAEPDWSVIVRQ
jgi:WD40 repeat protein